MARQAGALVHGAAEREHHAHGADAHVAEGHAVGLLDARAARGREEPQELGAEGREEQPRVERAHGGGGHDAVAHAALLRHRVLPHEGVGHLGRRHDAQEVEGLLDAEGYENSIEEE